MTFEELHDLTLEQYLGLLSDSDRELVTGSGFPLDQDELIHRSNFELSELKTEVVNSDYSNNLTAEQKARQLKIIDGIIYLHTYAVLEISAKKDQWFGNIIDNDNGNGKVKPDDNKKNEALDEDEDEDESIAQKALRLAAKQCSDLFLDQFGTPYAAVRINEHIETLSLKSSRFRNWLCKIYYNSEKNVLNNETVSNVLNILKARAEFDSGDRKNLYLRAAIIPEEPNTIYYDLTNKNWQFIRITATGWDIIESNDVPVIFKRYNSQLPQVYPSKSKDYPTDIFDQFIRLINIKEIENQDTKLLLKCYIISLLFENIPRPIKMVHGVQGAAKTTFQELIRMLIDPSPMKTLVFPRDGRELIQKLSHNYICYFDNVSYIKDWVSDELCRATTGLGFSNRELYTDDDDVIRSFMRSIGFNGINLGATRGDLLDRGLIFELERIPNEKRCEVKDVWAKFEIIRPQLLAYIFDILVKVLQVKQNGGIKLQSLPRMADFAINAEIISRCIGNKDNRFIDAFNKNVKIQVEEAIAANPVATAIAKLMEDSNYEEQGWKGSNTALLEELEAIAIALKINTNGKSWPKSPSILSRRINEAKTNLREIGIQIETSKDSKTKARVIEICKMPPLPPLPSPNENHAQNTSDIGDGTDGKGTALSSPGKVPPPKNPQNHAQNNNGDGRDDSDGTLHTLKGSDVNTIPNHQQKPQLYRIGDTDRWSCKHCNLNDDIHFMLQHKCRGNKK